MPEEQKLSLEDISKALAPYGSQYGGGIFGNSQFDDFRNYRGMLRQLNSMRGEVGREEYDTLASGLKGGMATAGAGMALSAITGLTGIANGAAQAAHVNDVNQYGSMISDYGMQGNYNYNNYSQLANDYAQNYLAPLPGYDDIRGMTGGQKAGSMVSSALSGASAGMAFGPWGAAAGAALGLAGSAIGIDRGNSIAKARQNTLAMKRENAEYGRIDNFSAAHERLGDYNFRSGVAHSVAEGGNIDRKKSIEGYMTSRQSKPKMKEHTSAGITRTYCDGGVRIRIRAK